MRLERNSKVRSEGGGDKVRTRFVSWNVDLRSVGAFEPRDEVPDSAVSSMNELRNAVNDSSSATFLFRSASCKFTHACESRSHASKSESQSDALK